MRDITPTQKPVPSNDIKDLLFNSGLLDKWATSLEKEYIDRFGSRHLTAAGMEWVFNQLVEKFNIDMDAAIRAAGYVLLDSFQQGVKLPNNEITLRNQALRDEQTGEYYRWNGAIPKRVLSGSTPESTGGTGGGAWVSVGDAALRSQMQDPDGARRFPELQISRWRDCGDARGWGLKFDGGDVTSRLKALADYANDNKIKITFPYGVDIKLSGSEVIEFYYSVDFNGSTIDVSNYSGVLKFTRPTKKVEYLPGSEVITALQKEAVLTGQYYSGLLDNTSLDDSFITIETDTPYFNYLGTVFNRKEMNHFIRSGVVSSPLRYDMPTNNITKVVSFKNEKVTTTVENFTLKLGNQTQTNVILIQHSRFKLKDVTLLSLNIQLTANPRLVVMTDCFDVELESVKANWANSTSLTGSYIFSANDCYDLRFTDCNAEGTGWGAVGTSSCQRMKYKNCNLSRIDSHMPFLERLDIDGGRVGAWGLTLSAIGDLHINGTEFVIDDMPKNAPQVAVIKSRTDVGGLFDGKIFLSGITLKNNSPSLEFIFAQLNTSGGVPAGSPVNYRFCESITIDGLTVLSDTEINIMPKVQQNSGCRFPSRIAYTNVTGANLRFFEQAFGGLTPSIETVTSQVSNMPLRGVPNTFISLDTVTLSRKGMSLAESNVTQRFLFDINLTNIKPQMGEVVYPAIELAVGGVVGISNTLTEGLDFYFGEYSNKPVRVSFSDGDIKHTGAYNTLMINGMNGFQDVSIRNSGLYAVTANSINSVTSAKISGSKTYLASGAIQPTIVSDMAGVAGTFTLLNDLLNIQNRYQIVIGVGSAASGYEFNMPSVGQAVYVASGSSAGVRITRSSERTITTEIFGGAYPRSILFL